MDGSPHIPETLRPASPQPAQQGVVAIPPSDGAHPIPAHLRPPEFDPDAPVITTRPGGSMFDYDRLVEALAIYEGEYGPAQVRVQRHRELIEAAARCGHPEGEPVIDWARRRVASYRDLMGRGVRELASAIAATNSLTRAIGGEG